jgi:bifunctional DNA-binding transcriptional regulator/antitoxin component of YhaV-PrlF toxin-antitoxin module
MVTATLTSKDRLTIPKVLRDSLHLLTGARVAFVEKVPQSICISIFRGISS